MNTSTQPSVQDLGRVALHAAEELDKRISNPSASKRYIKAFAQRLKTLFPGSGRPRLPADSLGLVCDIIEGWNNGGHRTTDYRAPMRIAKRVARTLEQPRISREEAVQLIRFCLALHSAARSGPAIHDIPEHHPYVLTFA